MPKSLITLSCIAALIVLTGCSDNPEVSGESAMAPTPTSVSPSQSLDAERDLQTANGLDDMQLKLFEASCQNWEINRSKGDHHAKAFCGCLADSLPNYASDEFIAAMDREYSGRELEAIFRYSQTIPFDDYRRMADRSATVIEMCDSSSR